MNAASVLPKNPLASEARLTHAARGSLGGALDLPCPFHRSTRKELAVPRSVRTVEPC
jgi:hypothetical protein